jgi:hypothetical protein
VRVCQVLMNQNATCTMCIGDYELRILSIETILHLCLTKTVILNDYFPNNDNVNEVIFIFFSNIKPIVYILRHVVHMDCKKHAFLLLTNMPIIDFP